MELTFTNRLKHAWNAFMNKDPTRQTEYLGSSYGYRPDRVRFTRGNEKSIVTAIYTRIAIDCASIDLKHVQLDENGRYASDRNSRLNDCLTLEANIDQTSRAFIQDVVMSMFDEGVIGLLPVDTDYDPNNTTSYDVLSMRTAQIIAWYPNHVRVKAYNQVTGQRQEIVFPKSAIPIIENPFYAIVNEPNSVMQRLIRKLNLLDYIDEQTNSGKLDLIVQLPHPIKSESQQAMAAARRKELEDQLHGSKYGVAYISSTEHITQLNRSVDNNLLTQCTNLSETLYSQLGITQSIMDGTADEKTMQNYYSRTIEPIMSLIADEMKRKFLTKTARTQGQSILFFRNPFKLIPVTEIAEIADKMTRNEIMTSNEIRQTIGMKPSNDPKADELRNSNLSEPSGDNQAVQEEYPEEMDEDAGTEEIGDFGNEPISNFE